MKTGLIIPVLISLIFSADIAFAEEDNYTHILVLGADQSVSNSETNKLNPVLSYYFNFLDESDNWYALFNLTTTNIKCTLGYKKNTYAFGVIPQFNHSIYGGSYLYDRGVFLENRTFAGHNAGVEFFLSNKFSEILKMGVAYLPKYHFYQKFKKNNPIYNVKEETEIDLPADHWQHNIIVESSLGKVESKDLDRIHHGVILKAKYKLTKRIGWEPYNDINPDTGEGKVSDKDILQRLYINFGAYYEITGLNLLLDIYGSIQHNIDRTDSEQIGSFVADHGIVPGYFYGEFLHNRYFVCRVQFGVPLPFWGTRMQPGFAALYMPEDNGVIGVGDYPKEIYKSVTFAVSTKMFNLVPVFFSYGFGIDADRINASGNTKKEGNHEFILYVLTAF